MLHINISDNEKNILLETAKQSVFYGLKKQQPLPVNVPDYSSTLQANAASFVTLNLHQQLRGCIGTLEAYQPLIKDVAEHAYAAAFQDPRFAPLNKNELEQLEFHISVLTPPEPIHFSSEKDLLAQLKPSVDGLILQAGFKKSTFLPAVWEQLNTPEEFLNHLKIKANLNKNDWPDDIKISRYQAISID